MGDWGYTASDGPTTWAKSYIKPGMGERQSPIDIVPAKAVHDKELGALNIVYKPEDKLCLENNGHSIMCKIKSHSELSGGPLKADKYLLEQFHFHWGSGKTAGGGSEHTIDGKQYAAELHLVHWNSTKYKSFAESAAESDGLAVLGIMIEEGEENPSFKPVAERIGSVISSHSTKEFDTPFDPETLLPEDRKQYWTYEGSLTTPPLYESVQWIVFKDTVKYSADQLKQLRNLKDSHGHNMQDNFRPPLPVQGRKVRASF